MSQGLENHVFDKLKCTLDCCGLSDEGKKRVAELLVITFSRATKQNQE